MVKYYIVYVSGYDVYYYTGGDGKDSFMFDEFKYAKCYTNIDAVNDALVTIAEYDGLNDIYINAEFVATPQGE